jgi:hypothetical protein
MKDWSESYAWLMGLLVTCCLLTMAHLYYLTHERRFMHRHNVVKFEGIDLAGNKWRPRDDAPCRIIRITSDNCIYCSKDEPSYSALISTARASHCEIIEVSPRSGEMADRPRAGVVQLKYISSDLGRGLFTPDTIILDQAFSEVWSQRGVLTPKGVHEAISVVEKQSRRIR